MRYSRTGRRRSALAAAAAVTLVASGCSAGSLGGSEGDGASPGAVSLTYLVDGGDNSVASANALIDAFMAENPDISMTLDTRPGGSEGDNIVKTKLSTSDMADVFIYNTGSLLQALKPEQNLIAVDDQPWVGDLDPAFAEAAKGADGNLYGAPTGTAFGGGILYNVPLYERLGLDVPLTWDEFMDNNAAIAADAEAVPVEQTYGDAWTSQMLILADYHNVEAQVPDFAAEYTAGTVKYADTPAALLSFEHMQEVRDAGYLNEDYASAKLNDGLTAVATGAAAHYPQIGVVAAGLESLVADQANDVGLFALPGEDADTNGLTVWPGSALYIPTTTEGDKLEAAKKFLAFATTQEGCDASAEGEAPQGPFLTTACSLPTEVSRVAEDTQAYFDAGATTPALEYKSPIKGPALEQILVQMGTGQVDAEEAAALYDQDVKKQAQQLGLPGWD